jgi:hypothetical protein
MTSSIRSHADALRAEITRVLVLNAPPGSAADAGTDQFVAGFVDLAIHASEGNTKPRDEYLAVIVPSVRASGISLAESIAGMVGLGMGGAAVLEGEQRVWWYRFCADYSARMATLWEASAP